jgi:hypothetical protein
VVPFNLIVLALAAGGMMLSGQITSRVLWIALSCLPATLIGAAVGARIYAGVSARTFQRVVLCLLLISGCILIAQATLVRSMSANGVAAAHRSKSTAVVLPPQMSTPTRSSGCGR